MPRQRKSIAIVLGTVALTLAALIAAVALIGAIAVTAHPEYGYEIYEYFDNARGKYLYAEKMYDKVRDGDAMTESLPALERVISDGLALNSDGGEAKGLATYIRTMLGAEQIAVYSATVDEHARKLSPPSYHVFVTGYEGYLAGEYVALTYEADTEKALGYALSRWAAFVDACAGDVSKVRSDLAFDTFVAAFARSPKGSHGATLESEFGDLLVAFDPQGAIAQAVASVDATDAEKAFGALHLAKTVVRVVQAYALLGYTDEAFGAAWEGEFTRLLSAYVTASKASTQG